MMGYNDFMINDGLILVDCDGVLLNWELSFDRWLRHYGYVTSEPDLSQYKMRLRYGFTQDHSDRLVRHFNESAMMSTLPPLRGAVKYVRKLHDEHGYKFHVITSQSNLYQAQQLRIQNLIDVFGNVFDGFTILDCGADKHEGLKPFKNSECWWIEDKLENALVGKDYGLNSILIGSSYVEEHPDVPILDSWSSIYNYITGE